MTLENQTREKQKWRGTLVEDLVSGSFLPVAMMSQTRLKDVVVESHRGSRSDSLTLTSWKNAHRALSFLPNTSAVRVFSRFTLIAQSAGCLLGRPFSPETAQLARGDSPSLPGPQAPGPGNVGSARLKGDTHALLDMGALFAVDTLLSPFSLLLLLIVPYLVPCPDPAGCEVFPRRLQCSEESTAHPCRKSSEHVYFP